MFALYSSVLSSELTQNKEMTEFTNTCGQNIGELTTERGGENCSGWEGHSLSDNENLYRYPLNLLIHLLSVGVDFIVTKELVNIANVKIA